MKNWFLISALCVFLVNANGQKVFKTLSQELKTIHSRSGINGFGACVFSKDSILYLEGFGYADKENTINYDRKTIQKTASISKLYLGAALVKAQELGYLDLDDPVNDYLPFKIANPHYPDENISIRHLATHTSGLKSLIKYDLKALYFPTPIGKIGNQLPFGLKRMIYKRVIKKINTNKEFDLATYLKNLYRKNGAWYKKKHFKKAKPGDEVEYSNMGASLLALAIEKASGVAYEDFVKHHLLDPLDLNRSQFDFQEDDGISESEYMHSGITIPNDYRLLLYPAGGISTSLEELCLFMQEVIKCSSGQGHILTQSSAQELISEDFASGYGVLWKVYPSGYVGHNGDIIGVTCYAYYNLKIDRGYIIFSNSAGTKKIEDTMDLIRTKLKESYAEITP